ncbi:MAG TPA: tetratricopeptide repeat protein, partial [Gemmataceae bacterium]|nr:tetratricopeptide repeat protein [Gemmataceae bacterium]
MQLGASLDKQKKYDESVKAYNAALAQIPKDTKATYSLHMAEGNRHMTAKRFPDAVIQFEAALRVIPNDPEATAALKKAKAGK